MAFRLPPLSALRVFEAAARHNSFQKAASELNLTASAVSHAIQTLENWLGVALFHRGSRGLKLTAAGEAYAPMVNQALSILAKATDRIPGRKASGTLAISSAPTFANKILLPLLDKFAAKFADIRVTIDTSRRRVDLTLDNFDIAIRFAPATKPAPPDWTLLAVETLMPVCSPALKKKLGGAPGADVLSRAPLIHVTSASTDWEHWFALNGTEAPASIETGLRVDTFQMGYDAAARGLGVVLGRSPLLDDEMASGRLVPLAAKPLPSGDAYWLVTPEADFQKHEVKLFRNWLLAELGIDGASKAAKSPVRKSAAAPRGKRATER
jgi:LysR family transcriptional regulator, glycine cleavage system transcriptional activator